MQRGKNFKSDVNHSMVGFRCAVLGNTTSAPTIPADGNFRPTTATYPKRMNAISTVASEAPTRSSAGVYVLTIAHSLVNVIPTSAVVLSAGSSPTAVLEATPTIMDPVARTVTVKTYVPSGTLTDIGTSDMLIVTFEAQDSNV